MRNYFVCGLALCLFACVTPKTVTLPEATSVLKNTSDRQLSKRAPATCVVQLTSIADERDDRTNLGNLGASKVVLEDGGKWLSNGLQALKAATYRVVQGNELPADVSGLKTVKAGIALKQLYMRHIATSKTANVVVVVQFLGDDGKPLSSQVMRGADTSVNWVNGDTEISNGFDLALEKLLEQLDERLINACRAKT